MNVVVKQTMRGNSATRPAWPLAQGWLELKALTQTGSWHGAGSVGHGWLECNVLLWRVGSLSRRDKVNT